MENCQFTFKIDIFEKNGKEFYGKVKSELYFTRFKRKDQDNFVQKKLKQLFHTAGFDEIIEPNDLTAVKIHFGEKGNKTHLPAVYAEPIVRLIKSLNGKPFLADTNVLYKSERDNSVDHIRLAYEHGFTFERVGAPVIIADGVAGRNELEIEINAPLNKKVAIAADFVTANSIIVLSHATGHLASGLGATIKNLGMGMASRKGKLIQHSVSKPTISKEKCNLCGLCFEWCPEGAIELTDEYARILEDLCIGCGECLAVCRHDAVKFKWDSSSDDLQKQIVEHALGIVKQKKRKIGYFTFLINMTRDCDCLRQPEKFLVEDLGVIAGKDPVAIDQAVIDLTREKAGSSLPQLAFPAIDPEVQLSYGEQVGLGTRKYKITEI